MAAKRATFYDPAFPKGLDISIDHAGLDGPVQNGEEFELPAGANEALLRKNPYLTFAGNKEGGDKD